MRAKLGAELALELVADKWFVLVMAELRHGTRRYNELKRAVSGVSQRMLTLTLRKMERDGFLRRDVYPEVPPRTEYTLTPLGRSLLEPLRELCLWANARYVEVESARRSYDARKRAQRNVA
ncbi:MAG: helix-turn-helix transcriptional regulator [Bryobacteraceae bacterium]|nr:helix-turn-helix transcriptional regulator [Bryobacteraceae bacterium]